MAKHVSFETAWAGEADCRNCAIRDSVLFAGLQETDFERIHRPIDQFTLEPGAVLYHTGDSGEQIYTVRSGVIKLVQYLPDGAQRIVRLARRTDVIGLEALLHHRYQHDAVVLQDTEVCQLPTDTVIALSRDNARLYEELLGRWQRALSEADAWLTELSTGSAKQRVARLLLRLIKSDPQAECELFSREDIGAMLGITTETASRTIAEFKRRGLLAEVGANRFVCDIQKLERLAAD